MLKVAIFICAGFSEKLEGPGLAAKSVLRRRQKKLLQNVGSLTHAPPHGFAAENVAGRASGNELCFGQREVLLEPA
jgi:hypothetical protein